MKLKRVQFTNSVKVGNNVATAVTIENANSDVKSLELDADIGIIRVIDKKGELVLVPLSNVKSMAPILEEPAPKGKK